MADDAPDAVPTPGERRQVPAWLDRTAGWTWRLLVVGVGIVVFWEIMGLLLVVTLPLAIAVILATLCMPVKDWLVERNVSHLWATVIVVLGGLAAFIGLFAAIAPSFITQLQELGPTVVQGWQDFLDWANNGPFGLDPQFIDNLVTTIEGAVSGGGGGSSGVVSGVLSGVSTVGQILAGLALTIVLLFFIVKDAPQLITWSGERIPDRHLATATALGRRAWSALSGYVRGTATIALIDALGIGIGLFVLQVPLVLPLMVLVFFGGFLPVVGAFTAGLVAVLVALASGGITTALLTLALILAVQQIEGNFLHPTIMRRAVSLHPIIVLTALAAGGALGGIIGAFLAVPVVAVVSAVSNEIRLRHELGLFDDGVDVPSEPIGGPQVDVPPDVAAAASSGPT